MLAAQIPGCFARLRLLQYPDDLFLAEPAPSHVLLLSIFGEPNILTGPVFREQVD